MDAYRWGRVPFNVAAVVSRPMLADIFDWLGGSMGEHEWIWWGLVGGALTACAFWWVRRS